MADTPSVPVSAPLPWWVVPGIAYTLIIAFIAVTLIIVMRGDKDFQPTVIQASILLVTGAAAFYFGSSKGSESKDATIASTSAALATSAPVDSSATTSDAAKSLAETIKAAS